MFGIDDLIIGIIIAASAASAVSLAVVIVVDYLSSSVVKKKVKTEVPESSYAQVEDIIHNSNGSTIGHVYHVSARRSDGTKLKVLEFRCSRSEPFYRGEKISVS